MNCFMCKCSVDDGFSNFTTDLGDCIVIVKNVPSRICGQCGEISYSDQVATRLEKIIDTVRNSLNTEIVVVSYTEQAA